MGATRAIALAVLLAGCTIAAPLDKDQSTSIVPGETELYDTYRGKAPPFPGNLTKPILPTSSASPAPDDLLWQNLLSAEWIVYSFYQQGVEKFNTTAFTDAGFPNTTYDRLQEIRDNEAGHMGIFYDEISDASVKPGPCEYDYGFSTVEEYLVLQMVIEVSSMAFLTGLVQQAHLNMSKGGLTAVAEVEARHAVWALIDIWGQDPFGGPADTVYPYANQILYITKPFVVPGSCPAANLPYPSPQLQLPYLDFNRTTSQGQPGDKIEFLFTGEIRPEFCAEKEYYAVYFHGVENITVPFDPKTGLSTVPSEFEVGKGVILVSIADVPGAVTEESVVAGPLVLLQQPQSLSVYAYK